MTAVFCDIYLFLISTLFKILGCATSSYVGSVLKKTCQKLATVNKGLIKVSFFGDVTYLRTIFQIRGFLCLGGAGWKKPKKEEIIQNNPSRHRK